MESNRCTMCKIEKHYNNFYKMYSECKDCNTKRLKRSYEDEAKISNQKKTYYEKNRAKMFLQKKNNRYLLFTI